MVDHPECQCTRCQGGCKHKPGWFKPEEVVTLAKRLGVTTKELFDKHLTIDVWFKDKEAPGGDVFVLSPATVGANNEGRMMGPEQNGECVFFKNGLCSIHTLGKPHECARALICTQTDGEGANVHVEAMKAWDNPEGQAMIEELYGQKPVFTDEMKQEHTMIVVDKIMPGFGKVLSGLMALNELIGGPDDKT